MAKRTWTDEEIALLAQHKVPQGRSLNAARIKAWELHIPFRPNDPNAEPTDPPRNPIQVPTWTEDDLAMLQEKVLPPNRTLSAAYSKANRMHVPFNRIRKQKTPQKLSKDEDRYENRKYILALIESAHIRKRMNDCWHMGDEEQYESFGQEYEGCIRRASREFGLDTLDVRVDSNRIYASLLSD